MYSSGTSYVFNFFRTTTCSLIASSLLFPSLESPGDIRFCVGAFFSANFRACLQRCVF